MTIARDRNPVRRRREQLGMLLVELAEKTGRSPGLISHIEGGYVPKLATMLKIADALRTTPDALWPEEVEVIQNGSGGGG